MAFYEFECQKCQQRFTVEQSFEQHDRQPRPKCPHCKSQSVRQYFDNVHVQTSRKA